ncbi:MAG TPA: HAMP domain-containing protein, partial [Dissulfurispiraceae bacterium]|nr:HAMP domain-containing protein [Dissulfurispiraceae bacterium]
MKITVQSAFRKLPIAQKFLLAVICLVLIIMIVVNSLVMTAQKSALRDEIENSHMLVIRTLAKDVTEPLMFLDPLRIDQHLQVTAQTPGYAYAMVLDKTGRVVAHSDRKHLGGDRSAEAEQSGGMSAERVRERSGDSADPVLREIWVPVRIGNEGIGAAVGGFSSSRIDALADENLAQLKRALFGITAAMLIVGIAGAFFLARVLTTPMKRLRERMGRVQSGDLRPDPDQSPSGKCWEMMECEHTTCPSYGKDMRCWMTPNLCGQCALASDGSRDRRGCHACPVYREIAGDEIGELEQSFEEMVARLRRSLDELEQSTREKARLEKMSALGEMSMTVAHEIKNPLNAIRGA